MKARVAAAFLVWVITSLPAASPAQSDAPREATTAELALIDAWVDREVAAARSGSDLEAYEIAVRAAQAALDAALARHERIDLERTREEVAARLRAIEARLAEVGRTCGPIPDTAPARARRDALLTVQQQLARGPFAP